MIRGSIWHYLGLSFRYRPLIWTVLICALGTAAGMRWAFALATADPTLSRAAPVLWLPLVPAVAFGIATIYYRNAAPQAARIFLGCVFACAFCFYAARRVLPPAGDIAFLARQTKEPPGAIKKTPITLRGWVAGFPQRGEFATRFPLQCIEADWKGRKSVAGNIWLQASPDVSVEIGQPIQVKTELSDLPRPGNPGERENWMSLIDKKCWSQGRVRERSDIRHLKAPPKFAFERSVTQAQSALLAHYERAFEGLSTPYPRATAQLLTAMAFGEGGLSRPLPRLHRDEFRAAGMSHILVASGTQISFIVLMVLGAARVLGARGWPLLFILLPLLFGYAVLAGGAAAIWRATVAGVCIALALMQGRDTDPLTLWSSAFLALILVDPAQLANLSFQLSFGATWGLIVLGPALSKLLHEIMGRNFLTDLMAFSLGAQAGVAPLVAYHFGKFSLAGVGANLVGVPMAGVLVATAIAGLVLPFQLVHLLNYHLAQRISQTATYAANLPGAQLEAPPLRLLWTLLIYGALLAGLLFATRFNGKTLLQKQTFLDHVWTPLQDEVLRAWQRRKPRWRWQALLIALLCGLVIWQGVRAWSTRPTMLQVTMLDVGQGESIFIRSPAHRTVLIDGGTLSQAERGDVGRTVIVPFLQTKNVKKLDVLVITHTDADHCNGLLAVVREVPIGMVLDGANTDDPMAAEYLELRRALELRGVPIVKARSGQKVNLGAGAVLRVLAPLTPPFRGENADNNNAAVLKLDYGKTDFLLTGDIEKEAEARLARRGADLQCTVLKIAHHGSKSSTQELFLKAGRPQVALISCGRYNKFGHPSSEVLERLSKSRIAAFRTDVHGAIEVSCDGNSCWIQTMR